MSQKDAVWYLPGEGGQTDGPYTAGQIFESLRKGQTPATTLCWREGMSDWKPLAQVELFASTLAGTNIRKNLIRFRCHCGNKMAVSKEHIGRQVKCKSCGEILTIPGSAGSDSVTASSDRANADENNKQVTQGDSTPHVPPGKLVVRKTSQSQDAVLAPQSAPMMPAAESVRANVRLGLTSPTPTQEETIWEGRPSLAYHMFGFISCGVWIVVWITLAMKAPRLLDMLKEKLPELLPEIEPYLASPHVKSDYLVWFFILICIWAFWRMVRRVLVYLNWYYVFTTQRFKVRRGILSREFLQLELFRVKDISVLQTFWGRLFNYTHIHIISTDRILKNPTWAGLPGGLTTAEQIRSAAQLARSQTGVTTIRE